MEVMGQRPPVMVEPVGKEWLESEPDKDGIKGTQNTETTSRTRGRVGMSPRERATPTTTSTAMRRLYVPQPQTRLPRLPTHSATQPPPTPTLHPKSVPRNENPAD
ncbi:hypothetical protein AB1N83_013178 [Pleurotus pulmonarius]